MKLKGGVEKYILRKAISELGLIPEEICWRTKEAMSDGVSLDERSWSTIIQHSIQQKQYAHLEYIETPAEPGPQQPVPAPAIIEKQWFKQLFDNNYPGCSKTIPYDWLPKWCGNVQDASARTLDVYKEKMNPCKEVNEIL
jgi:asparagine synthase (glutamine-hydrolysing)